MADYDHHLMNINNKHIYQKLFSTLKTQYAFVSNDLNIYLIAPKPKAEADSRFSFFSFVKTTRMVSKAIHCLAVV